MMKRLGQLVAVLLLAVSPLNAGAPTLHGYATAPADNGSQGDGATVPVTPPGSMASGDLVLIYGVMGNNLAGQMAISATGGQTWNSSTEYTNASDTTIVFWAQFNGTWSANPSIAFANVAGTRASTAVMLAFRPDVVGTWALDTDLAGATHGSTSPLTVTGITPSNNDNVTVATWTQRPLASTWGSLSGAGWVATSPTQFRNLASTDHTIAFAYQLQGTAAATGNATYTPSGTASGSLHTVAFYNTPGGGADDDSPQQVID